MTQEPTSAQPEAPAPTTQPPVDATPTFATPEASSDAAPLAPPAKPSKRGSGVPSWLPYFVVMALPAIIVGVAVYLVAGGDSGNGGGGGGSAAGVIDGFIRFSADGEVASFAGKVPPEFPTEFPLASGMKPVASFEIPADEEEEGLSYFAVFSTPGSAEDVYNFYLETMDKDPWQVEVARASKEFTGIRFSRPDNPDIEGDVTITRSDLTNGTYVFVSVRDISKKPSTDDQPFAAAPSRPLPAGFPNDIPIFKGKADSIITDTYFERAQGGRSFIVSFLTKDSQDDVLKFYRAEFEKRGWTVTDSTTAPTSARDLRLSINFTDSRNQEFSGTVRTDIFADDRSYTEVDLLIQVTRRSNRGN